jgi:serine/threonine protein kinase/WD40 repeat protein
MSEREIFDAALAIDDPVERAAYLEHVCAGNADLRQHIEGLLSVHGEVGNFLELPAAALVNIAEAPASDQAGAVIGPYKLLEQIGEGGFGVVYLAQQTEPVRRKVALKVLKPGMDTRQVVARFEAERQALALMDHPNIAKVYDGGVTRDEGRGTGPLATRPYFVMELVKGVPITTYCDRNQLTLRERLEVFISVCHAVHHAHQKGIIHRDLKPSNVMVALYDGTPVVKVIDFGIAKALRQPLTDKTLFTNFTQMVGTPLYMSPEQAGMSNLDIDTRTDIYALGVLLYELLTGATPFEEARLRQASYDELRRIIREEEPPKPSTRLSTLGPAAATASANRQSDPQRLRQCVRGELDWIVMKALEKDRNRRYESASGFAADVQRYLANEPVQACPPSAWYLSRKFVRRNRGAVAVAVATTLTVFLAAVGLAVSNVLITREKNEKALALQEREAALTAAQTSERDARDQLFQALLHRARAERSSGRVGQRFETLKVLRQAAAIRVTPELGIEAAAALVLPDVEVAKQWEVPVQGGIGLSFDAAFQSYVRLDKQLGVTVCRLIDGREEVLISLHFHGEPMPLGLRMSPDGRFVAYGHGGAPGAVAGKLRLWRLDTPTPCVLLDDVDAVFETVIFHADGQFLAYGRANGVVSVMDLATGQCVRKFATGDSPSGLAFHPRDRRLAVAGGSSVRLYDTPSGRELPALHSATVDWTHSVAWHPDGRRLAAGCSDRKIHLWDTATGVEATPPWTHGDEDLRLAFNHAGDRLVSKGHGYHSRLWDTTTGRLLLEMPGNFGLQFTPDDHLLGPEIRGNQVRLWRVADGRELRLLRSRNPVRFNQLGNPVLHKDGGILAANSEGVLSFFDLDSGEELATVPMPSERSICPFCFDSSGAWLTVGTSGLLQWPTQQDPAHADTLRVGPPHRLASGVDWPLSVGASAGPGGRVLAIPDGAYTTVIHRDRPERTFKLGPQTDVRHCAVSATWVVTCTHWPDGQSRGARVWTADTGRHVLDLPLNGYVLAMFSPNGQRLATRSLEGGKGEELRLWETGAWREVMRFEGASFAFSPDSRSLALNDVIGAIRLVEIDSGREVGRVSGLELKPFARICFTADGSRLIATTYNDGIYVWDLRAIRAQLKAEGLDWDWPELPPVSESPRFRKVEVLRGDLAGLVQTRGEQARRAIEQYRRQVRADPKSANACNNLAWSYVSAPEALRDVKAAVTLAEQAVRAAPGNAMYANTLGAAYYRAGRYRDAITTLRPNLEKQEDWGLAFDLYFLAMSHQRLGEATRAKDYHDWATRWIRTQQGLAATYLEELALFRAEAEDVLGIARKKD